MKVKTEQLKYVVIDKTTKKAHIYRFKVDVSTKTGISTRTLDRKMPYENEIYLILRVESINI